MIQSRHISDVAQALLFQWIFDEGQADANNLDACHVRARPTRDGLDAALTRPYYDRTCLITFNFLNN